MALGLAIGLLYDCFRVLRVRLHLPLLGGILDLLFWLLVTAALFLHALITEAGVLRLYMVAAVLGGAVLYFKLLSRWCLALGYRLATLAALFVRLVTFPLTCAAALGKKMGSGAKKNFHYWRKW